MKNKTVWMGFIATFIALAALDTFGNMVLFKSSMAAMSNIMRPEAEMMSKFWIIFVTYAFFCLPFSWIFSKGYENKGIMEGLRYGLAVGLMFQIPFSYGMYVFIPIPYSFALQSFLYGTFEVVVLGIILSWVFGMKPKGQA
jgi:hypothetical protein